MWRNQFKLNICTVLFHHLFLFVFVFSFLFSSIFSVFTYPNSTCVLWFDITDIHLHILINCTECHVPGHQGDDSWFPQWFPGTRHPLKSIIIIIIFFISLLFLEILNVLFYQYANMWLTIKGVRGRGKNTWKYFIYIEMYVFLHQKPIWWLEVIKQLMMSFVHLTRNTHTFSLTPILLYYIFPSMWDMWLIHICCSFLCACSGSQATNSLSEAYRSMSLVFDNLDCVDLFYFTQQQNYLFDIFLFVVWHSEFIFIHQNLDIRYLYVAMVSASLHREKWPGNNSYLYVCLSKSISCYYIRNCM